MSAMRLCPACGTAAPIGADEPVWPTGWRCASCGHVAPLRDGIVLTAPALADTVSGFDPADFAFLAQAEGGHFWFAPRRLLIRDLVARHFPAARDLIEIGCGTGNVLSALAPARDWRRVVGTDIHPTGLTLARPRLPATVELLQLDARHMPFRDAFDLLGAFDVLEHIEEDTAALRGFAEALVPGGGLIVSVPQHPFLWSAADEIAHHARRYRRGELEARLREAGFDIVFSTSFTALLLPLMLANRLRVGPAARHADPRAVALAEFTMAHWLNAMLGAVNRLEAALTRRGMRWPVGGSRIVLGRRR